MILGKKRAKLHAEHAEHSGVLRIITLLMAWSAGIALGIATGDLAIAILLTAVMTAGHMVSWRTRLWQSVRWQLLLLAPTSIVALLLVPSLPQAFQGDWLYFMRYLLLLQALTSFYLHSRASLYTAQLLSGIVLLVSSQLAFDSAFLFFFFTFFALLLVFLAAATRTDAIRGAVAVGGWSSGGQRALWTTGAVATLALASLGAFLLLPWGTLNIAGSANAMLPLTGQPVEPSGTDGASGAHDVRPPAAPEAPGTLGGSSVGQGQDATSAPVPRNASSETDRFGRTPQKADGSSLDFGAGTGSGNAVAGDPVSNGALPSPTIMQVRSPVATYWRGQTYSRFDGARWLPDARVRFASATQPAQARYVQTFFLKDALRTPVFGYTPLQWHPVGQTTASLLEPGDVYRVTSERRSFHPAELRRTTEANVVNRGPDRYLPQSVKDLARQITRDAPDALGKSLAITEFLRSNYQHVASADQFAPLQPVEQFLFGNHRAGNAFDFASAQTALAIASGLEARLVTGYLPGELDPLSGTYVVRANDAHAWTEVNFRGATGWVPFDGNPRADGQARATTRGGAAGTVAGLFDLRIGDEVRDAFKVAVQQMAGLAPPLLLAIGAGAAAAGLAFAVRWMLRRRRRPAGYSLLNDAHRRELLRAYDRLMKRTRRQVPPRLSGETIDQYFARVARAHPAAWQDLAYLRDRLNEAAYRPAPPSDAEVEDAHWRLTGIRRIIQPGAGA